MPQGNAQKTPIQRSLNVVAQRRAEDIVQSQGRSLPCSVVSVTGSIVKVKFEVTGNVQLPQVTMPVFGPEYIRYPIQPGDRGVALSADAYLGGMSGLGGGVADLSLQANLSALVFFPIGNKGWFSVDGNILVMYGPNGVTLRDKAGLCQLKLTAAGVEIDGPLHVTGPVTFDGALTVGGLLTGAAASFSGALSAASAVLAGNLNAVNAILSGGLSAVTGAFSGAFSALSAAITNLMAAGSVTSGTTIVGTGNVTGAEVIASGGSPLVVPVRLGHHVHGTTGVAGNTTVPSANIPP